jgi:motility quorum-sensing regulator/GCU-specific mRNA interferase toxin
MEKRRPHYDLRSIQAAFTSTRALHISRTAQDNALSLGITLGDIVDIVQRIERQNFYKSMTSLRDPRTWQDVYHVKWRDFVLYVKFTVDSHGYFIISFKEK